MRVASIVAALGIGWATATAATAPAILAQAHVVDGDTLSVDMRLQGIDAFERSQACQDQAGRCFACGDAARSYMKHLLLAEGGAKGRQVVEIRIVDATSYGRPIITATSGGTDIGLLMISAGLALPEIQYLRGDPARTAAYSAAYAQALAAKRGGLKGSWLAPSAWRHGKRLSCEAAARGRRE